MSEATWAEISAVSATNDAASVWSVHDTKDIIADGETITIEIIGFNHDDLTSGGKAGISFGMVNLMSKQMGMFTTGRRWADFTKTDVYTYINGTVYENFDSSLKGAIKAVNKKCDVTDQTGYHVNTYSMNLFAFARGEVNTYQSNTGTPYQAYTSQANRIKKLSNGSGETYNWWLRDTAGEISFYRVEENGGISGGLSSNNQNVGVCFGFCV